MTRIADLHRRLRERPVARSEADEYGPIEYGGLPVVLQINPIAGPSSGQLQTRHPSGVTAT